MSFQAAAAIVLQGRLAAQDRARASRCCSCRHQAQLVVGLPQTLRWKWVRKCLAKDGLHSSTIVPSALRVRGLEAFLVKVMPQEWVQPGVVFRFTAVVVVHPGKSFSIGPLPNLGVWAIRQAPRSPGDARRWLRSSEGRKARLRAASQKFCQSLPRRLPARRPRRYPLQAGVVHVRPLAVRGLQAPSVKIVPEIWVNRVVVG